MEIKKCQLTYCLFSLTWNNFCCDVVARIILKASTYLTRKSSISMQRKPDRLSADRATVFSTDAEYSCQKYSWTQAYSCSSEDFHPLWSRQTQGLTSDLGLEAPHKAPFSVHLDDLLKLNILNDSYIIHELINIRPPTFTHQNRFGIQ